MHHSGGSFSLFFLFPFFFLSFSSSCFPVFLFCPWFLLVILQSMALEEEEEVCMYLTVPSTYIAHGSPNYQSIDPSINQSINEDCFRKRGDIVRHKQRCKHDDDNDSYNEVDGTRTARGYCSRSRPRRGEPCIRRILFNNPLPVPLASKAPFTIYPLVPFGVYDGINHLLT